MPGQGIGELNVGIMAHTGRATRNVNKFRKDLGRIPRTAQQTSRSLGVVRRSLAGFAGQLAAVATAAAGLAAVRRAFTEIDQIAKRGQLLGINTEDLVGLQHAAEQTGVEFRTMALGIQRMTRRMSEAAVGSGEAQGAIKELGLDARELNQLSPDETFRRIAGAMSEVGNRSDQLRLAFKLFDSEGATLLNTLSLGEDGLKAMQRQAEAMGLTFTDLEANRVEAANDAMNRMKGSVAGLTRQLAIMMAPAVETLANAWSNLFAFMRDGLDGVERLLRERSAAERLAKEAEAAKQAAKEHKKQQEALRKFQEERQKREEKYLNTLNTLLDAERERIALAKGNQGLVDRVNLERQGLGGADVRSVMNLRREADFQEDVAEQKKVLDELRKEIANFGKDGLTVRREEFLSQAATDELAERGARLFDKLAEKQAAEREAQQQQELARRSEQIRSSRRNDLLDANTAEGFRALRASLRKGGPQEKILEENQKQNKNLERIAVAVERQANESADEVFSID